MQTVSRYLLNNVVIVGVNGYNGRNSIVYDRRIKLYKGVNNPLGFTFKNEDQKAQNIQGKKFEFNLIDSETKRSVVMRDLQILDDGSTQSTKGKASVTITEGDLLTLDAKFYNYSIREIDSDDSTIRTVTFADTAYNAAGSVEILDGAYPDFVDSDLIASFTGTTGPLTFTSPTIEANPGVNNNNALHTIAIYQKNFVGTLRVQGTMVSSPGNDDFFDIDNIAFTNATNALVYYNFNGVYENIRFSWGNTAGNHGRIDKILYRH